MNTECKHEKTTIVMISENSGKDRLAVCNKCHKTVPADHNTRYIKAGCYKEDEWT
ncbi:MAG: hypothetical protein ACFFDT_22675 [Candidatus Hodarchaeota archaeon]